MERIRFISHEGHRVLLVDLTGCNATEVATTVDQVPKFLAAEPPGSTLILGDFTGSTLSREALERVKIAAAIDRKHVKKSAWVLNGSFPKPLFESVKTFTKRDIRTFDSRDDALSYLIA